MNGQSQPDFHPNRDEKRLRSNLRDAFPELPLSLALVDRVALAAEESEHQHSRERVWNVRLRFGVALGGALVACILALALRPRLAAAADLRRIQSAILDTHSAHITSWDLLPDGAYIKLREIWYQQGQWRIDFREGKSIEVCTKGQHFTYEAAQHLVCVEHAQRPIGYESMSGFSLTASVADATRSGLQSRLERQREVQLAGRDAIEYLETMDIYPMLRLRLWVDATTDLPIRTQAERSNDGRWIPAGVTEFRFNERLNAALFTPNFPRTARTFDRDAARPYWQQRLSRAWMRQKTGDAEIVLRDVQVNSEGDVFALFTRGITVEQMGGSPMVTLTDDQGTRYLQPSTRLPRYLLEPDAYGTGFCFQGAALEGAYFIPVHPQMPWPPRRFTLTITAPEFYNNSATQKPHSDAVTLNGRPASRFTFAIDRPAVAYTPEYMPYMDHGLGGPGDDYAVRYEATITRAAYYQFTLQDYEHALELYEQALAMDVAENERTGAKRANEEELFARYQTLTALGRHEEACTTLKQAHNLDIYSKKTKEKIEDAMRKEGLL